MFSRFFLDFPARSMPNSAGIPAARDSEQVPTESIFGGDRFAQGNLRTKSLDDILSALGVKRTQFYEFYEHLNHWRRQYES
jgi:hypothetical protein